MSGSGMAPARRGEVLVGRVMRAGKGKKAGQRYGDGNDGATHPSLHRAGRQIA